jgi:hypothetical protein
VVFDFIHIATRLLRPADPPHAARFFC